MRAQCGNMFKDVFFTHDLMFSSQNPMGEIETMRRDVQDVADGARTFPPLRFISFKMTNYCNSDCVYCAHAVSRREEGKGQIPFPIIRGAIEDAARLGCTAIAINGGEPLLMPEIREIIRTMIENRIVPVLMTNGLLLPQKWEALGQAGLKYVIISFDSMRKEVYEKQRGVPFERAMAGIDAALRMKDRFPDMEIHVSAVLTKDNQDDFVELVQYLSDRGIKIHISPSRLRTPFYSIQGIVFVFIFTFQVALADALR